jgi:Tetratrico peptide repeat
MAVEEIFSRPRPIEMTSASRSITSGSCCSGFPKIGTRCTSTAAPWTPPEGRSRPPPCTSGPSRPGSMGTFREGQIQYGSTLRNLGRYEEAVVVLSRARREFPESDSVRMFLALALVSAGRGNEAVAELINLALDRVDGEDAQRSQRSLRGYTARLSGPARS